MSPFRVGVKVVPNASRDQIVGWLGEDLKVRVQSPPEGGRANQRVCRLLAGELGLPKDAVSVVAGQSNARKTLEIRGLSPADFESRLGKA